MEKDRGLIQARRTGGKRDKVDKGRVKDGWGLDIRWIKG